MQQCLISHLQGKAQPGVSGQDATTPSGGYKKLSTMAGTPLPVIKKKPQALTEDDGKTALYKLYDQHYKSQAQVGAGSSSSGVNPALENASQAGGQSSTANTTQAGGNPFTAQQIHQVNIAMKAVYLKGDCLNAKSVKHFRDYLDQEYRANNSVHLARLIDDSASDEISRALFIRGSVPESNREEWKKWSLKDISIALGTIFPCENNDDGGKPLKRVRTKTGLR